MMQKVSSFDFGVSQSVTGKTMPMQHRMGTFLDSGQDNTNKERDGLCFSCPVPKIQRAPSPH